MSIARLEVWVTTVVQCLVEKKKLKEHRLIEYVDKNERKMVTA